MPSERRKLITQENPNMIDNVSENLVNHPAIAAALQPPSRLIQNTDLAIDEADAERMLASWEKSDCYIAGRVLAPHSPGAMVGWRTRVFVRETEAAPDGWLPPGMVEVTRADMLKQLDIVAN